MIEEVGNGSAWLPHNAGEVNWTTGHPDAAELGTAEFALQDLSMELPHNLHQFVYINFIVFLDFFRQLDFISDFISNFISDFSEKVPNESFEAEPPHSPPHGLTAFTAVGAAVVTEDTLVAGAAAPVGGVDCEAWEPPSGVTPRPGRGSSGNLRDHIGMEDDRSI